MPHQNLSSHLRGLYQSQWLAHRVRPHFWSRSKSVLFASVPIEPHFHIATDCLGFTGFMRLQDTTTAHLCLQPQESICADIEALRQHPTYARAHAWDCHAAQAQPAQHQMMRLGHSAMAGNSGLSQLVGTEFSHGKQLSSVMSGILLLLKLTHELLEQEDVELVVKAICLRWSLNTHNMCTKGHGLLIQWQFLLKKQALGPCCNVTEPKLSVFL